MHPKHDRVLDTDKLQDPECIARGLRYMYIRNVFTTYRIVIYLHGNTENMFNKKTTKTF